MKPYGAGVGVDAAEDDAAGVEQVEPGRAATGSAGRYRRLGELGDPPSPMQQSGKRLDRRTGLCSFSNQLVVFIQKAEVRAARAADDWLRSAAGVLYGNHPSLRDPRSRQPEALSIQVL